MQLKKSDDISFKFKTVKIKLPWTHPRIDFKCDFLKLKNIINE